MSKNAPSECLLLLCRKNFYQDHRKAFFKNRSLMHGSTRNEHEIALFYYERIAAFYGLASPFTRRDLVWFHKFAAERKCGFPGENVVDIVRRIMQLKHIVL